MKRLTTVLAVALAIILATDSTIDASIIIKKDLRQLATECDRIVVGRVLSQRCSWVGGKVIYTHTTVQVSRTLKGKADKTIVISEPGGRIGDTICVVPGVPGYQVKERVLVMVKKGRPRPRSHLRVGPGQVPDASKSIQ